MKRTVVRVATTSTVNITGFRTMTRGSSFLKASSRAALSIAGSPRVETAVRRRCCESVSSMVCPRLKQGSGAHRGLLDQRAERQCREVGETADDHDHADHQTHEQRAVGREGAA